MRIIIVGYGDVQYPANAMTRELRARGHDVYLLATDLHPRSKMIDQTTLNDHVCDTVFQYLNAGKILHPGIGIGDYMVELQHNLRSVLFSKCIAPDKINWADLILDVQHDLLIDYRDVDIKFAYYYTEIMKPVVPLVDKIDYLFYAFPNALKYLEMAHPSILNHINSEHRCYLPHAVCAAAFPEEIPDSPGRSRPIGFLGTIDYGSTNPILRELYAKRVDILPRFNEVLHNRLGLYFQSDWLGQARNHQQFVDFMLTVKLAPNIPGHNCFINDRMFIAPYLGCVLLQYAENPLLCSDLGLVDGKNCLFFRSTRELESILFNPLNWRSDSEFQQMATKGREWALTQTWTQRIETFIQLCIH